MTDSSPEIRISVIIPAYNVQATIDRAIRSVLTQTRKPDEIIIVNDGSTDDTAAVVNPYQSQEVVQYIEQQNQGAGAARNTGILVARHEWIAFLDGDDEWLADHMERHSSLLSQHAELVWSTGNYYRCLCTQNHRQQAQSNLGLPEPDLSNDYYQAFLERDHGCMNTMVVRKDVLLEAGLFDADAPILEDLDLWLKIAHRHQRIGIVRTPTAVYHLEIAGCRTQSMFPAAFLKELMDRHLQLAQNAERSDAFAVCARHLLQGWLRSMLFDARGKDARALLDHFEFLFRPMYKWRMRLFCRHATATAFTFHAISRILRILRLRRELTRPPTKKPGS